MPSSSATAEMESCTPRHRRSNWLRFEIADAPTLWPPSSAAVHRFLLLLVQFSDRDAMAYLPTESLVCPLEANAQQVVRWSPQAPTEGGDQRHPVAR